MFGKTDMMTAEATFGTSKAFAAVQALADIQAARAKRDRLATLALAAFAFAATFAAVLIMGA